MESVLDLARRLLGGLIDAPQPWRPHPRLSRLPFALHLVVGHSSVELFPPGPLDVLRLFQRHHDSRVHDLEYVLCRPEGAGRDALRAYGVVRLRPELAVALPEPSEVERALRQDYGTFLELPRASGLLVQRHGQHLDDEDPPEGMLRVETPEGEVPQRGRLTVREVLAIVRKQLSGPAIVGWLEGAFRQPPPTGRVEHRYYLDPEACLWVVRHDAKGKLLFRSEVSEQALRPLAHP